MPGWPVCSPKQLQELPAGQGTLLGEPFKFEGRSRDEMTWICSAGPGLLTRYASGDYSVTLRLRPMPKGNRMELGIVRESEDDANPSNENKIVGSLIDQPQQHRDSLFRSAIECLGRSLDRSRHAAAFGSPNDRPRAGSSVPWEAVLPCAGRRFRK